MSILDQSKAHQMFFEELTKIPHGSENEKALSDYLVQFAKQRNLKVIQDSANNVIVYKDASIGFENSPAVMLQAHMDMVNEKNGDSDHNFEKDPLDIYVEDGFLKAHGTTLGADDGAGVAYIMAVLDDRTLQHPRLNALFTTGEESTMNGAFQVDPALFDAQRLINLDCIDEGISTTASSGGIDVLFHRSIQWTPNQNNCYECKVSGLYGGHSGGAIHLERGNAIKIISRLLHRLHDALGITLYDLHGGLKVNAIPHIASASFASNADVGEVTAVIQKVTNDIKKELAYTDKHVEIDIQVNDQAKLVADQNSSDAIIDLLYLLPCGFRHKSDHLNGITVASENFGVVSIQESGFDLAVSMRGALDSYVFDMKDECYTLGQILGFQMKEANWYPSWEYVEDSPLRDKMKAIYQETHHEELVFEAVHGGLECGIFKAKMPKLDIVTLGVNMKDVHTPKEKLDLKSFDRSYEYLCKLLSSL